MSPATAPKLNWKTILVVSLLSIVGIGLLQYIFTHISIFGEAGVIMGYESYYLMSYLQWALLIVLGYIFFRKTQAKFLKILLITAVLITLGIILKNLLLTANESSISFGYLSAGIIYMFPRTLISMGIGAVLGRFIQNNKETVNSNIYKKTFFHAAIVTFVVITANVISMFLKMYFVIALSNPIAIFFDPDFITSLVELIPVTLTYYFLLILLWKIALKGRRGSESLVAKVGYFMMLVSLCFIHLGLAYIGMLMMAFGGG